MSIEFIQSEQQREKRLGKRSRTSGMSGTRAKDLKFLSVDSQKENKRVRTKRVFKGIMAKNLGNDTDQQIQKAQVNFKLDKLKETNI